MQVDKVITVFKGKGETLKTRPTLCPRCNRWLEYTEIKHGQRAVCGCGIEVLSVKVWA